MSTLNLTIAHDQRPFFGPTVLMFYDGPQVFWLPVPGRSLLALALGDGGPWPFLVIELSLEQAVAIAAGDMSFRAACLAASDQWLMPDYDADQLVLVPLDAIPEAWLPRDGGMCGSGES